ncbi:MAG: dCTP deaminase [Patescibacteria group bacterium]|nr:dCTP deaminase [Patescibacteria group bacterium]MDE2439029.1 dCTP deaminase [Patescibacteria group bacterium]
MVKPDTWIQKKSRLEEMISPFSKGQARKGVISYGVSSYGYDVRLGNKLRVCTRTSYTLLNPKTSNFDNLFESYEVDRGEPFDIPSHSFALGYSLEYFKIPRDILVICFGKSTYARCGVIVNVTPLEPEWEGNITIEISNTSPHPARIYPGEGICQLIFLQANEVCAKSYADKKGKYQGQKGITLPKVSR